MTPQKSSLGRRLWHHIYSRMLAGLLFVLPVALTVWVLQLLYGFVDGWLRPLLDPILKRAFGWEIPAVGLIITLFLLYGSGILAANVFGRRLLETWESLLRRLPLVKSIYNASRQVVRALSRSEQPAFQKVVWVEFPSKGLWTVAFQVGKIQTSDGRTWVKVYVATTPNPTSGFLEFYPEDTVQQTDIAVEDALKMIVSGGILSPERIELSSDHTNLFS